MGAESQPVPVPGTATTGRGGGPCGVAQRRHVSWPLSRADASHGRPWSQRAHYWTTLEPVRARRVVPSICCFCARSMPRAPEHRVKPMACTQQPLRMCAKFCAMRGGLVVVSFFSPKQILGKYSSDRKLSKALAQMLPGNQKLQVQFPKKAGCGVLYICPKLPPNTSKVVARWMSFLCMHNKLPQDLAVENDKHFLSQSFSGSRIQLDRPSM